MPHSSISRCFHSPHLGTIERERERERVFLKSALEATLCDQNSGHALRLVSGRFAPVHGHGVPARGRPHVAPREAQRRQYRCERAKRRARASRVFATLSIVSKRRRLWKLSRPSGLESVANTTTSKSMPSFGSQVKLDTLSEDVTRFYVAQIAAAVGAVSLPNGRRGQSSLWGKET